MSRELTTALLTFLSGIIVLANQFLPVPPELQPWLAFAVAVISLALATFFGTTAYKARNAARNL